MATDDYIAWAQTWCPEPVASERGALDDAKGAYDAVDERIGDDAEHDDFLTRVLWLETAIRLARLGWTIRELEDCRWPVSGAGVVHELVRRGI